MWNAVDSNKFNIAQVALENHFPWKGHLDGEKMYLAGIFFSSAPSLGLKGIFCVLIKALSPSIPAHLV